MGNKTTNRKGYQDHHPFLFWVRLTKGLQSGKERRQW